MSGHEWEVTTSPLAYSGRTVVTINYREERIVSSSWEVNLKGRGGLGAGRRGQYGTLHAT